jgi:hypothetical protein
MLRGTDERLGLLFFVMGESNWRERSLARHDHANAGAGSRHKAQQ